MANPMSADRTTLSAPDHNSGVNGCLNCHGYPGRTAICPHFAKWTTHHRPISFWHAGLNAAAARMRNVLLCDQAKCTNADGRLESVRIGGGILWSRTVLVDAMGHGLTEKRWWYSYVRRVSYLADLIRGFTMIQLSGYTERFAQVRLEIHTCMESQLANV